MKEIAPLKRKTETLEKKFAEAQSKLTRIDTRLASEDLFTTNPEEAVKLGQNRVKIEALIQSLEMQWMLALEAYELARERERLD